MPFTAKEAYRIRKWATENPGLPPEMREWFQLLDETIMADAVFPTTTTTTSTTTTTTA